MNIILISLFATPTLEGDNSRLNNIIKAIGDNHEITVITSNFDHDKKYIRHTMPSKINDVSMKYISVPKYRRNVSLARLNSHFFFSKRLKKVLNNLDKRPDLIYCTMPATSPAYVVGKFCKTNRIPFVVDVIDLWPNSLIPILPCKRIIEFLVYPWLRMSRKAYSLASFISAESREYMEEAKRYNKNAPSTYTYLGVDIERTRKLIASSDIEIPEKPKNEIWLCYGGNLGNSYDFNSILKAITAIHVRGIKYKMWFIGGGEKEKEIREYANRSGLNVEITGRIGYADYLKYLQSCDIAFNSFLPETLVVHSYKFNDYVACGCYVVNSLKGETADLLEETGIGITYTPSSIEKQIVEVCENLELIKDDLPQRFNRAVAEYLNISTIYPRLIDSISKGLSVEISH